MRLSTLGHIACIGLSLVFLRCDSGGPTDVAGGSDEAGNALCYGYVKNSDGTPAKNAVVRFISVSHNPYISQTITDSTTTDSTGWYGINTLSADTYNVFAAGVRDSLSFIDSVAFAGDTMKVSQSILHKPGSISGSVELENGGNPNSAFIFTFGANAIITPGANGSFAFSSMAAGSYPVRVFTILPDYAVLDTVLTSIAGINNTLAHPIRLKYTGIPVPNGLSIAYDTLMQVVTLSWNQPAIGRRVAAYAIYRQHWDSNIVLLKTNWQDTVFSDSTALQDQTYEYRVAAIDTAHTEGVKSVGASVTIASAFTFVRVFAPIGSNDGEVAAPSNLTTDRNGNLYVVDYGNFRIQKLDSAGHMSFKFGTYGQADSQFISPYGIAVDSNNNVYITDETMVKKFNNLGAFSMAWAVKGNAYGIAVSPSQKVFVTTAAAHNMVQVFSTTSDSLVEWSLPSGGRGIAFKNDSTIFVSCENGMLYQYSDNGALQAYWSLPGVSQGFSFTMNAENELFAAMNISYNGIYVLDGDGGLYARFGNAGNGIGLLNSPKGVAVVGENIFISDHIGIQLFKK